MKRPADNFTGLVSSDWLARGVWLSEAAVTLADGNGAQMLQMMREGAERFTELQEGLTPEAFAIQSDRPLRQREAELTGEALHAWRKYRGGLETLRMGLMHRLRYEDLLAFGVFGDPTRPVVEVQWIPQIAWHHLTVEERTRNEATGASGVWRYIKVVAPAQYQPAPSQRLPKASDDEAIEALRRAYSSKSPLNSVEAWKIARDNLAALGKELTKQRALDFQDVEEFKSQRGPVGKRRTT